MRGSPHYLSSTQTDEGWVAKCMCGWRADAAVANSFDMIEVFNDHVAHEKEE